MRLKKGYGSLLSGVFVFLLFLLLVSFQSRAQQQMTTATEGQTMDNPSGNIHVGPLKIHPGFSVTEAYTSNLFMEYADKKGSFITTYTPYVKLQLPIQRHFLELDYHADMIEAQRYHKQYDVDNHFANAILHLDFNRLNFKMGDNWQNNSVPPENKDDIRKEYIQNRAFFEVSYQLANRYTVTGFYRYTFQDFDSTRSPFAPTIDPKWDNYWENDMGVDLFYRVLPLTSVVFEYGYTQHTQNDQGLPDTDRDYDAQRYWLGLTWETTAKLTGTIKGGYSQTNYVSDSTSQDWSSYGMEGDLKYKLTSFDTFTLTLQRQLQVTSATATHTPGFAPGIYGTNYINTGGTLEYAHKFTYKISGFINASYFNNDYREKGTLGKKRNDDLVSAGAGASYQIQDWLRFKFGYQYTNNASNVNVESYQGNLFYGTLSLGL